MPATANYFQAVPTRNPSEVMIRVRETAQNLRADQIPTIGTKYKNTNLAVKARATNSDGYGDYEYVHMQGDGSEIWFYFGKPKTDEEKLVPFRTFNTSKRQSWPAVLQAISFIPDTKMQNSALGTDGGAIFSPRLYARIQSIPEAFALCRVQIEQFLAPTQFPIPRHVQPVAGNIQWDFNGARGSFNALHPDIEFPAQGNTYSTLVNGVAGESVGPYMGKRIFPATTMETWQPYILHDEQVLENGMYFRERARIFPPAQPDPDIV